MRLILTTIILTMLAQPVWADLEDVFSSNVDVAGGCLTTIDIKITERLAEQSDLIIDYDYGKIRKEGVLMNVYYSNVAARAQWTDFPSPSNIYLMPSSIFIPIGRWVQNGMKTDGTWWARIVLLRAGNC